MLCFYDSAENLCLTEHTCPQQDLGFSLIPKSFEYIFCLCDIWDIQNYFHLNHNPSYLWIKAHWKYRVSRKNVKLVVFFINPLSEKKTNSVKNVPRTFSFSQISLKFLCNFSIFIQWQRHHLLGNLTPAHLVHNMQNNFGYKEGKWYFLFNPSNFDSNSSI